MSASEQLLAVGKAFLDAGRPEEAMAPLQESFSLRPDVRTMLCIGQALVAMARHAEAVPILREVVRHDPQNDAAHCAYGTALARVGLTRQAMDAYDAAIRIAPASALPYSAKAGIYLSTLGETQKAVALCRQAIAADPVTTDYHSNLLLALQYRSCWTPEEVFQEHLVWAKAHAQYPWNFEHGKRPSGGRRLRVGYVSADFRNHVVSYFFEAIARHHDHGQVEVFLYSEVADPDDMTRSLMGYADHWRPIYGLSNEQVARLVYQDQIDILVDLAGHSGIRRLKMFARKPAPIQVTYLGYPATTGLEAMDYRLVDAVTDPVGQTERYHTEELVRLPGSFLCYTPPTYAPEIGPLPCAGNGHVTFVNFNNFAKISEEWAALAARILKAVPHSRCMIKSCYLCENDGSRERITGMFGTQGIGPERLILLTNEASQRAHLARYGQVDIALDAYPYNGTTTTCEALWMGVPVVTLAGPTHVSRVGASLLTAVGLPELVAAGPDEYVRIAVELAGRPDRLRALRLGMRERMRPLTDGAAFTAKLEHAYREMFDRWQKARP